MRYAIDLSEGRSARRWRPRLNGERLLEVFTSTGVLMAMVGAVVLAVAYFTAMDLLRGMSSQEKAKVKELRLIQASFAKERESLLEQTKTLLALKYQSPDWASRLRGIGDAVPEGLWLTRIVLQEPQAKKGAPSSQPQPQAGKMLLLVEGRVDARSFSSVLEPVSLLVSRLKSDPELSSLLPDLELVSLQSTKEDPMTVSFQLKGTWDFGQWRGKPEERIKEELQRAGLR
jgi:hypothetical protein